ncbi:ABC transporter ATP-binding protein [Vibrio sp. HI00D65]|uniref:ABC transporter ATP-binding protein n=1 Tax=Vibrio sp. HI00D65 TaxID=1822216 RepID=UPI0007BA4699|nr:ABC transporter ATP-binding protein [Vibrio sp. HI00D65]
MSDLLLKVENVTVEYTNKIGIFNTFKHKAIDNISFEIRKGEILGILGGNGAGKSTLLKVLAGVLSPDSGKVTMSQNTTRSLLSLGLGFNNELTGRDNVILSAMFNGYSKSQALKVCEEIKEFSELNEFFEQPVKTYSSGMRARLGFASGLITDVDILMIDEVLAVGDKSFRKKAEKALLNKLGGGQTVLFVSHSEAQIKRICQRCIKLPTGEEVTLNESELTKKPKAEPVIKIAQGDAKIHRNLVKKIISKDYKELEELAGNSASTLRNIAICIEDIDLEMANYFMHKALELRPTGTLIINKVEEYKKKLGRNKL